MPRSCTTFTHPEKQSISKGLVEGQLPLRSIAQRYWTSEAGDRRGP